MCFSGCPGGSGHEVLGVIVAAAGITPLAVVGVGTSTPLLVVGVGIAELNAVFMCISVGHRR